MRAEDVKPGMWVRDRDETFQVTGHIDDLWFRIAYLDGQSGMMERAYARQVEPWVPRVGEWVRFTEHATRDPWQVRGFDGDYVRGWMDSKNMACAALPSCVEPCAPPAAKPETRACRFVREATPEQIVAAIINDKIPPEAEWRAGWDKTRDHNATCPKCGGKAYQGLLNAKCVEPVCDDPETREPECVAPCILMTPGDHIEEGWEAYGRGRHGKHPTREGAIAAWRKAVRRG